MSETPYDRGERVRREVLGDEHVERAKRRTSDLDRDFQRFITEGAWGSVWARPDLDRRTRSLVTVAILAGLTLVPALSPSRRCKARTPCGGASASCCRDSRRTLLP